MKETKRFEVIYLDRGRIHVKGMIEPRELLALMDVWREFGYDTVLRPIDDDGVVIAKWGEQCGQDNPIQQF